MEKKYVDINTGKPLNPGDFYVPASSTKLLETVVYHASRCRVPRDRNNKVPKDMTSFSKIQDPAKYLDSLVSQSQEYQQAASFISKGLLKKISRSKPQKATAKKSSMSPKKRSDSDTIYGDGHTDSWLHDSVAE